MDQRVILHGRLFHVANVPSTGSSASNRNLTPVLSSSQRCQQRASVAFKGFQAQVAQQPVHNVQRVAQGLFAMSRPINLLPSFLLSLSGSWMSANYSPGVLLMPPVWISSACSALIAAASMLVNDCFDHRNGTDGLNNRKSALENGEIDPSHVALAAGSIYAGVMLAACFLEQSNLRLLITLSAYMTFVYTPLLKKVMVVKNIVVAGVIACSTIAGGLAVTHGTLIPFRTLASSLYLFLAILGREVLMDVKDVDGDRSSGVWTIPACFGQQAGVLVAAICAAAANVFLAQMVWIRNKSWYASMVLTSVNLGMLASWSSKLVTLLAQGVGTVERVIVDGGSLERLIAHDSMLSLALGVVTIATCL